jgi:LmbE family N-acetylglucosaminyl deacetylase
MKSSSRRKFLQRSLSGLGVLAMPAGVQAATNKPFKKMKIVCVGGHPDDPESICGGTLAKFAAAGHDVTIIYLTRGEAGIEGKSHNEAADIRSKEAVAASKILNARPVFAGQIDGDTIVNNEWVMKMQELLAAEKPDVVFTHWPIDTHKDHQAASLLTIQAWVRSANKFDLYFCEACPGSQTLGFHPDCYIDITGTQEQKRKAIYCHTSQDPRVFMIVATPVQKISRKRTGCKAAEAFVHMTGKEKEI